MSLDCDGRDRARQIGWFGSATRDAGFLVFEPGLPLNKLSECHNCEDEINYDNMHMHERIENRNIIIDLFLIVLGLSGPGKLDNGKRRFCFPNDACSGTGGRAVGRDKCRGRRHLLCSC